MSKRYSVGIVDEANYQQAIAALREGEHVDLVPEPGNAQDKRAVAVQDGEGATIGYLPRDHWLTGALIEEGKFCTARIERIEGGDESRPNLGVVLEVDVGPAEPVAPKAAKVSEASRKARSERLRASLGPSPDEDAKRLAGDPEKPNNLKAGCVLVVVFALLLAYCGRDDSGIPGDELATVDPESISEAGKSNVEGWYGQILAAARPCDEGSKVMADAMTGVAEGRGSTFAAYQAATQAEGLCRETWSRLNDIDTPGDVPEAIEEAAEEAVDTCENAFIAKQMAAEKAAELFDGNMRNSVMSELTELTQQGQAGVLACVAGALQVVDKAGVSLDDV